MSLRDRVRVLLAPAPLFPPPDPPVLKLVPPPEVPLDPAPVVPPAVAVYVPTAEVLEAAMPGDDLEQEMREARAQFTRAQELHVEAQQLSKRAVILDARARRTREWNHFSEGIAAAWAAPLRSQDR